MSIASGSIRDFKTHELDDMVWALLFGIDKKRSDIRTILRGFGEYQEEFLNPHSAQQDTDEDIKRYVNSMNGQMNTLFDDIKRYQILKNRIAKIIDMRERGVIHDPSAPLAAPGDEPVLIFEDDDGQ